ncbi:response regulator transcription factor [Actinoallomurus vinaceus]|uniref:response regulator transcription factor n=1 Tax=Actinoallomurus vinaceus TaxID=1080074 RepID=UPI0031E96EE8
MDDRPLSLAGLRSILMGERDVTVVGEACEAEEALRLTKALSPEVVVIDALSHQIDAVGLAAAMADEYGPDVPGVMLLADTPDIRLIEAFRNGVRALLLKNSSSEDLIAALHMVAAGYVLMAPTAGTSCTAFQNTMIDLDDTAVKEKLAGLTARERDVLDLVARGLSNSEISETLSVSESTVKSHVRSTLAKLGLRNRVQLVILAYRLGLARPRQAGLIAVAAEPVG